MSPSAETTHTKTITILVIEDEIALSTSYKKFLESQGYQVTHAHDGKEGLAVLEQSSPDLILLDLNMPKLDGVGFLEQAHLAENHPSTKVIVFTNSEDDDRIEKAFERGADRYVLKAMLAPQELARIIKEEITK